MGFSRAQVSIEYLTNYGIAAIVIVVVLGALVYLGVLFPSRPPVCVFQKGIECGSQYIPYGNNTAAITAYNRFDDAIVIYGVLCSAEQIDPATALPRGRSLNDPSASPPTINGVTLPQAAGNEPVVEANGKFDVRAYCYTETGSGVGSLGRQDRFSGLVFIRYRLQSSPAIPGSGFMHTIQGNMQDYPSGDLAAAPPPPPVCNNDGTCGSGETLANCPSDCLCGNGVCVFPETHASCPSDCLCGNGICDGAEDCHSCTADCGFPGPGGACLVSMD